MRGKLNPDYTKNKISIYGKQYEETDTGEEKSSLVSLYVDVPCALYPMESDVTYEVDGVKHMSTHKVFLNNQLDDGTEIQLPEDSIVFNDERGRRYMLLSKKYWEYNELDSEGRGFYEIVVGSVSNEIYEQITRLNIEARARIRQLTQYTYLQTKARITHG